MTTQEIHNEITAIMEDWNFSTLYTNEVVDGKNRSLFQSPDFTFGVDTTETSKLVLNIFISATGELFQEDEEVEDLEDFQDFINAFVNQVFI